MEQQFTRYEIARIIGARALQIAMDAPLLLDIPEAELKEMKFDPIRIAEKELESNVLPIAINRPTPKKRKEKLAVIKEEKVSDEELAAKEQEVEKDIAENAEEIGFAENEEENLEMDSGSEEQ